MAGAIGALAILVAVWLALARGFGRRRAFDAEAALLRACHGDIEQAERLIAGERARMPGLSRPAAAARALDRRRRDNR